MVDISENMEPRVLQAMLDERIKKLEEYRGKVLGTWTGKLISDLINDVEEDIKKIKNALLQAGNNAHA